MRALSLERQLERCVLWKMLVEHHGLGEVMVQ